ncbi:MAG: N-acetyltransferase [Sphingobium sp.]|nr:N-acetyltransferase [Sphingobium sp.]
MEIRPATSGDLDAICHVHGMAFAASEHGHHGEADLVRALHDEGDVLVSLCAFENDTLIGHILFSRVMAEADRTQLAASALAPVAVLPDHRAKGIAASLIRAGHEALRAHGIRIDFVLGDPAYYGRFGYEAVRAEPFASPYAGPHFMACALDSAVPTPQRGAAIHATAFARLA